VSLRLVVDGSLLCGSWFALGSQCRFYSLAMWWRQFSRILCQISCFHVGYRISLNGRWFFVATFGAPSCFNISSSVREDWVYLCKG